MLVLKDINVTLGKNTTLERHVLKDLSLYAAPGEFAVVIGGNGAGKSTMFNIISGSLVPDSGSVIIDNTDVTCVKNRATDVAKVVQDPRMGTVADMTVLENMAFALLRGKKRKLYPFTNSMREKLFREKLSVLNMGLEERLGEPVANFSGGQRQALSLVMAMLAEAKIILLDEITAALDPKAAEHVMCTADKIIREERRTCVMVTHNMSHALRFGDRILLLKEGKFIKEFRDKSGLTAGMLAAEFGEV